MKTDAVKIDQDIRAAASETKLVLMEYNKDGEVKEYVLEPYSYRFHSNGRTFFGFDQTENKLKQFSFDRILKVTVLDKVFKPRWPVELKK